jgi:hypothetical protein
LTVPSIGSTTPRDAGRAALGIRLLAEEAVPRPLGGQPRADVRFDLAVRFGDDVGDGGLGGGDGDALGAPPPGELSGFTCNVDRECFQLFRQGHVSTLSSPHPQAASWDPCAH